MALSEFALIERYFTRVGNPRGVALGIGDDCALLEVPPGQQLAVSIDTLVEGVHFPAGTPSADIARRALGACLSDLAAMGAEPAWLTLALTLPRSDEAWLDGFSRALAEGSAHYGVALVGGDTTRGPLAISLQVHGWVPKGKAMCRGGARPGDLIYVSGSLGDAMAGLDQQQHAESPDPYLLERFLAPTPRLGLGQRLRGFASAGIDISDGLLADLGHILEHSGGGAVIEMAALPLSEPLCSLYGRERALEWALSGGEDFELCFTVAPERRGALEQALASQPVPCTAIGVIEAESGLRCRDNGGRLSTRSPAGYRHF